MTKAGMVEGSLAAIFDDLIAQIAKEAKLLDVIVGLHWTAVSVELAGQARCGLASSVVGEHAHGEADNVGPAGRLRLLSPIELAELVYSESPTERALGMATINACLNVPRADWIQSSAVKVLAARGQGRSIALIGHFPFIPELEAAAAELFVLEKEPLPGEYPSAEAGNILPRCQVVGVTSMTLINGTFDRLLSHIQPEAFTMLLGPSTPMNPVLFEYGIDMLAGTHIERVDAVMEAIKEGANYRQIHKIGTRLVTMAVDQTGSR